MLWDRIGAVRCYQTHCTVGVIGAVQCVISSTSRLKCRRFLSSLTQRTTLTPPLHTIVTPKIIVLGLLSLPIVALFTTTVIDVSAALMSPILHLSLSSDSTSIDSCTTINKIITLPVPQHHCLYECYVVLCDETNWCSPCSTYWKRRKERGLDIRVADVWI